VSNAVRSTQVVIVVDAAFGSRLASLPTDVPVWVVDTPINARVARELWAANRSGLTTFKPGSEASPEAWCSSVLGQVDLHHGPYSQNPPYNEVRVIGTAPSAELRTALAEFGLVEIRSEPGGFVARFSAARDS